VPRPKLAAPSGRPQRPRTQRPGFQVGAVTVAELAQLRRHGPSTLALPASPGWGRSFGGPCHREFIIAGVDISSVGHHFCDWHGPPTGSELSSMVEVIVLLLVLLSAGIFLAHAIKAYQAQ
jgi:hypothetical protein